LINENAARYFFDHPKTGWFGKKKDSDLEDGVRGLAEIFVTRLQQLHGLQLSGRLLVPGGEEYLWAA
jgi:hypothetical protein